MTALHLMTRDGVLCWTPNPAGSVNRVAEVTCRRCHKLLDGIREQVDGWVREARRRRTVAAAVATTGLTDVYAFAGTLGSASEWVQEILGSVAIFLTESGYTVAAPERAA